MSTKISPAPDSFFQSVREILTEARGKVAVRINSIMVETYWRIGQRIVEQEQAGSARAGYGQQLIRELSRRLGDEFGKGFSVSNLKNFRQFYLAFPDLGIGYALRSELGWTHYRLIMRVEDSRARDYYIREAVEQGWSTRALERNIADKDETIVRYSVLNENAQLFAAKYLRVLPSEEELARELEARHVLEPKVEGEEG